MLCGEWRLVAWRRKQRCLLFESFVSVEKHRMTLAQVQIGHVHRLHLSMIQSLTWALIEVHLLYHEQIVICKTEIGS